jgi:hypothetical protein
MKYDTSVSDMSMLNARKKNREKKRKSERAKERKK